MTSQENKYREASIGRKDHSYDWRVLCINTKSRGFTNGPIDFIEKDAFEELKKENEELKFRLLDRSEKYSIAIDKGVLEQHHKIEQLEKENEELKAEIMFAKESLKYDESDREQITQAAKHSYNKYARSAKGQTITEADSFVYHLIGAAKEKQNKDIEKLTQALKVAEGALRLISDPDENEPNWFNLESRKALAEIKKIKGE